MASNSNGDSKVYRENFSYNGGNIIDSSKGRVSERTVFRGRRKVIDMSKSHVGFLTSSTAIAATPLRQWHLVTCGSASTGVSASLDDKVEEVNVSSNTRLIFSSYC
ncbi:conserved hypothetical protein [Ricinus communis]|uniref:Uncharacterized protein n=1 Tax=Ricinus communis TaxID=3988 RepID=B9SWE2_RICCO|nr:conserved hypothetical protein [Ricinus communis]